MSVDEERTPLLLDATTGLTLYRTQSKDVDINIIDFDPDYDEDNPQDWPKSYKWTITALLALQAFTTTFTCIGVVPVADGIVRSLNPHHEGDKSASVLLVTIWELGEAAGPLLIGPLSELFGRYPVMSVANVLFVGFTVLAATAQSTTTFIAARALTGVAVAANVLNPAIVGDIFISEQRGTAMSLIMFAPLIGGAIGPAIAGGVAETLGWRAIIWLSVVLMSVCTLCVLFVLRETYKVIILRRRVAHLQATTGNSRLRTPYDSTATSLATSIFRPFHVFISSPAIILISLFASTTFTFFYIMSTTFPEILDTFYHLSPAQTGSTFIFFSAGSLVAVVLCNMTLDPIYIYLRDRPLRRYRHQLQHYHDQQQQQQQQQEQQSADIDTDSHHQMLPPTKPTITSRPHHRLPPIIFGAIFLPITIALYGLLPTHFSLSSPSSSSSSSSSFSNLYLQQQEDPNPAPLPYTLLNLSLLGFFLLLSFLPVLPYITDLAPLYSASAMTAVIVVRCLFGTFLPLCVDPVVARYGWGRAFLGLALACAAMAVVPVGLWVYGERTEHGRSARRWGSDGASGRWNCFSRADVM